ncbi:hypothetical protein ACIHCX_03090 [Streptomyces sp. NPDC052043]|uniref:hypothetical protein n=1 Tax=Streptomyces sp. NPDC052043 TaxID=3365684 RepID=UPI0037CFD55C
MNAPNLDSGLAAVLDHVREVHGPIGEAITDGKEITAADCALLSGAVGALLDAIDVRTEAPRLKEAA